MHPRRYETLIMLAPNLAADELETVKNKIDGIIGAEKGQVVAFEDWGRRRLAYPVKKEMFGHYLLYDFQGSPASANELERILKIDEKVFKYLTLVLDKKFTDEDLAAIKEKIATDAARRDAEKAKIEEARAEALAAKEAAVEDAPAAEEAKTEAPAAKEAAVEDTPATEEAKAENAPVAEEAAVEDAPVAEAPKTDNAE